MMAIPKDILDTNRGISDWSIMTCYRGSIAHGMFVPSSDPDSIDDKDVISVCVPPQSYYLGLDNYGSRGTKELFMREWDIVIYELRKYIHLLAKGNPNTLCTLWINDQYYIKKTPAFDLILKNRDLFSAKHVYNSFVGYAHGQLHRMTHCKFEGYMGSKRKSLVDKHGYDTKSAAHLIRLLRMGREFLSLGKLLVERPDAEQLLEIKRGEWSLDRVKREAEKLFDQIRYAFVYSSLPADIDMEAVNRLCVEAAKMALNY